MADVFWLAEWQMKNYFRQGLQIGWEIFAVFAGICQTALSDIRKGKGVLLKSSIMY